MEKLSKKELEKKLTPKQKIFCHEYIIDWNATRSAKVAGYSEKTATETGCENLRKPNIEQYIDFIKNDYEKECGISKVGQLKGFLDIIENKDSNFNHKISARTEINKMMGYNEAEKLDHTTKGESINDLSRMSTDELIKRSEAIKKLNE